MKKSIYAIRQFCIAGVLTVLSTNVLAEDCIIDVALSENLTNANKQSAAAVEFYQRTDLKKNACLPSLDSLSGNLGGSIPSFSNFAKGLATKIKNMACKAMDNAISSNAEKLNAQWEIPFGLGSVGGGVSTDGTSGVNFTQSSNTQSRLENEILNNAGNLINSSLSSVSSGIDKSTGEITGVRTEEADEFDENLRRLKEKSRNVLGNF